MDTRLLTVNSMSNRIIKILKGSVRFETTNSIDASSMIICTLGEGSLFGYGGLLNKPEFVNAVAATDVEIAEYPIAFLYVIFEMFPDLAGHFYHFLCTSITAFLEAVAKTPTKKPLSRHSTTNANLKVEKKDKKMRKNSLDLRKDTTIELDPNANNIPPETQHIPPETQHIPPETQPVTVPNEKFASFNTTKNFWKQVLDVNPEPNDKKGDKKEKKQKKRKSSYEMTGIIVTEEEKVTETIPIAASTTDVDESEKLTSSAGKNTVIEAISVSTPSLETSCEVSITEVLKTET